MRPERATVQTPPLRTRREPHGCFTALAEHPNPAHAGRVFLTSREGLTESRTILAPTSLDAALVRGSASSWSPQKRNRSVGRSRPLIGFGPNGPVEHMEQKTRDVDVLDDIKRVATEVGHSPSVSEYGEHGEYSWSTITRHFDTWNKAKEKAGLDTTPSKGPGPIRADVLLNDMRRVAEEIGRSPTAKDYKEKGEYAFDTVEARFGTWNEAKEAAGLELLEEAYPEGKEYACTNCGKLFRSEAERDAQCPHCGRNVMLWRGAIRAVGRLKSVQRLAEGPATGDDIGSLPFEVRESVFKLSVTTAEPTKLESKRQVTTVYYLAGDLRRAVDLFISENTAVVEAAMSGTRNDILRSSFPDDIYEMIVEQWEWGYGGGEYDTVIEYEDELEEAWERDLE